MEKPIELKIEELTNKIINDCSQSQIPLILLDSTIEKIYKYVHEEYKKDTNKRIKEYEDSLKEPTDESIKNKEE